MKKFVLVSIFLILILFIFSLIPKSTAPTPTANNLNAIHNLKIKHIFLIVMENKSYYQIINNPSAPFINNLAKNNFLTTNYSGVTHPSLPNYLSLIGANTFGIHSDCNNCSVNAKNLIDLLEEKNITWKAYMENMPNSCFLGNSYPYAQKHNPFIYFNDIKNNTRRCNNIVSLQILDKDLKNDSTTPNFVWITPNLCNDMHDCQITIGDNWLKNEVNQILSSPAFTHQSSLLFITWDEGEILNNHIPLIVAGSVVKHSTSNTSYNHYSLLHTIEVIWNLPPLNNNDRNAPIISNFFS